jgi:hypothetical protein
MRIFQMNGTLFKEIPKKLQTEFNQFIDLSSSAQGCHREVLKVKIGRIEAPPKAPSAR